MSEKGKLFGIIALVIAVVVILVIVLTLLVSYNGLVSGEEAVSSKESQYGAALDICSEKIEIVYTVFERYLDHESEVFQNTTKARASFYQAASEGNPAETVNAALDFELYAVHEAYPQLVSGAVSQQTITSLEESINEIKTALDDWIYQVQIYNTRRKSAPTNMIGDWFDFPKELDYYHSEKAKLDVSEIIG